MRVGIDLGTTHTVVAVAHRGNYPVVSFQTDGGEVHQWYPAIVGARSDELAYGLDAYDKQHAEGWTFLRSFKRLLSQHGPDTPVRIGDRQVPLLELLAGYLTQLRRDLRERSNLEIGPRDTLDSFIAVPANANSNQRFLTAEGFRRAGFNVIGMINEPSAAGIEYAERFANRGLTGRRVFLAVYDLGGGTFDSSVIGMKDQQHEVITDEGISELGGDDFDAILLDLALSRLGNPAEIDELARFELLEECRRQKESLSPNRRRITIDVSRAFKGAGEVIVPVDEFYERCAPLVELTVEALERAMERALEKIGIGWLDVAAVYLTGGSSDLPIVGRLLRERYGRRVRRSPFPYSATAIGLAIAADSGRTHELHEHFTRYFGLWRESDCGRRVVFDTIFAKDTPLLGPSDPPLTRIRTYNPAHNIGHYSFLECSRLSPEGEPDGDITPWGDILFELDPSLYGRSGLSESAVRRMESLSDQLIEERYTCDARGVITVTIANLTAGYERTYTIRASGRASVPPRRRSRLAAPAARPGS
ncbi:MAG: Hsp70 family protein [Acidobacteria bacterium]|nr:Hsp70 family protein [Acidobacteriota bacterium]